MHQLTIAEHKIIARGTPPSLHARRYIKNRSLHRSYSHIHADLGPHAHTEFNILTQHTPRAVSGHLHTCPTL